MRETQQVHDKRRARQFAARVDKIQNALRPKRVGHQKNFVMKIKFKFYGDIVKRLSLKTLKYLFGGRVTRPTPSYFPPPPAVEIHYDRFTLLIPRHGAAKRVVCFSTTVQKLLAHDSSVRSLGGCRRRRPFWCPHVCATRGIGHISTRQTQAPAYDGVFPNLFCFSGGRFEKYNCCARVEVIPK